MAARKPRVVSPERQLAAQNRQLRKAARDALRVRRGELGTARVDRQDLNRIAPRERKAAIAAIRAKAKTRRGELAAKYRAQLVALKEATAHAVAAVRQHWADKKKAAVELVAIRRRAVQQARALVEQYMTAAQRGARRAARARLGYFSEALDTGARAIEHELPAALALWRTYGRSKLAKQDYARALADLKRRHPRGDFHPADAGEAMAIWFLESMEERGKSGLTAGEEYAQAKAEADFLKYEECQARQNAIIESTLDLDDPDDRAEARFLLEECDRYIRGDR